MSTLDPLLTLAKVRYQAAELYRYIRDIPMIGFRDCSAPRTGKDLPEGILGSNYLSDFFSPVYP